MVLWTNIAQEYRLHAGLILQSSFVGFFVIAFIKTKAAVRVYKSHAVTSVSSSVTQTFLTVTSAETVILKSK